MASLISWAEKNAKKVVNQVNPLDNGRTFKQAAPTNNRSVVQQAAPIALKAAYLPEYLAGKTATTVASRIPSLPNSNLVGRSLNDFVINPIKQPAAHVNSLLNGHNPYHGTNGQIAGQIGQDVINAGSVLPIGRGAKIATKAAPFALKVAQGAKLGAKAGAGFGAAQGLTTSLQNKQNLPQTLKNVGVNAGIGLAGGAALGGVAPVIDAGAGMARKGVKAVGTQLPKASRKVADAASLTPRVTVQEQRALRDYSDHLAGSNPASGDELYNTINSAKAAAAKHGVDITSGSREQQHINTNKLLDTIGQKNKAIVEGGYVKAGKTSTSPEEVLPGAAKPTTGQAGKIDGAALPKNTMNADSYASTFGVSKEQAVQDIADASKKPATRPAPKLRTPVTPATAAENTAKNPIKTTVPEVAAGDYQQARINPQLASHPVNIAMDQALVASKKLGLDTSTFGKMVEGDLPPRNAADAKAVEAYRQMTNRTHASSQALGGNTPYVQNYFRHEWDLSNPEDAAKFDKLATAGGQLDPYAFSGLDRQPRVFKSIAQGEALGFKLKNQNLQDEIRSYGSGSAHALKQQALAKALTEADMGEAVKPHTFDLGGGKSILLSDKGIHEAKGYTKSLATNNPVVKAYRTGNRGFKQMLLSVSQFHPINISALRAAPTLTLRGHPVMATKGLFDTFAAQASKGYSMKLQTAALRDGTIEDSARIGAPIKFGSDYAVEGKVGFGKGGLGEKAIFERAMPAMHIQMVKGAVADLKSRGIPLDSPEAHALGTRINEIMGFVNQEVRNLDRGTQRRLGDIFLAPQFTRAKWATNKSAVTQGGLAGSYARRSIVGNAAAAATVAMGVGYALHQKSDNINDVLLRSVFHPSVPTPLKDKKGNTMELGLPATQSSEVLGLLGFSLKRGSNGHLSVDWKGGNVPSNAANYGRSRLAILPAAGLKLKTNTDYAGKPLYSDTADRKTQAIQAATTLGAGLLPIGGQGIAQTNLVKSHLPQASQQVLNANSPGTNPLLKSVGASFGLTPKTDKTVGKGQQTTQYFDALNNASKGLNSQEKAAFTMVTGSKKDPVSGQYAVAPTNDDSRAKATALLQNPKVIDRLLAMNSDLAAKGQAVDPLYTASKDQITKYYQYQAMPPGSADKADWMNKNKDWYQPVADARNTFFNNLPAGDPNKPKASIQYPDATPAVANLMTQYDNLTASADKSTFIKAHPEVVDQWDKQSAYTNAMREAQGYAALKTSPKATPQLQNYMDSYNAADKATRKSIRNSNPLAYQGMIAYYDSVDMHNINKAGALDQLVGEPDQTSKQNKAIQGLAKDIYQAPDGSYQIVPAGWMNGLSNGSGSGYGYKAKKAKVPKLAKIKTPKIKAYKPKTYTVKAAKAPSYKASRSKMPTYAVKTPKVTKKALA